MFLSPITNVDTSPVPELSKVTDSPTTYLNSFLYTISTVVAVLETTLPIPK